MTRRGPDSQPAKGIGARAARALPLLCTPRSREPLDATDREAARARSLTTYAAAQELASRLPERTAAEREEAETRMLRFVTSVRWQFARTMPHIPHEYTVLKGRPELKEEFVWFATYVLHHGKVEAWGPYRHSYYYLGGHKYWTMDDLVGDTDLINRESTTGTPCRPGVECEP